MAINRKTVFLEEWLTNCDKLEAGLYHFLINDPCNHLLTVVYMASVNYSKRKLICPSVKTCVSWFILGKEKKKDNLTGKTRREKSYIQNSVRSNETKKLKIKFLCFLIIFSLVFFLSVPKSLISFLKFPLERICRAVFFNFPLELLTIDGRRRNSVLTGNPKNGKGI